MPDVLTVSQIAKMLGTHVATVRRWCAMGQLPARRVGSSYICRREDLEAFERPRRGNPNFGRRDAN